VIFYFTGTGNSLYVARNLGDGDVRSIPQELAHADRSYAANTIGIVSPVYYHELPRPVKEFIRTSTFSCDYFFIVGTYGNRHGGFAELTRRFLEECGKQADYINTVIMVDNALPGYDIAEQLRIDPDKHVNEHIAAVKDDIAQRRAFIQPVTDADLAHHFAYVERGIIAPTDEDPLYAVTDACVSCGTCEDVCPTGCITLSDGHPTWDYAKCAICMACIHACPATAIRFATLPEKNPGVHYRNPHVSLADIVAANTPSR